MFCNSPSYTVFLFIACFPLGMLAQPVADFSTNLPTPACVPLSATFTNASSGASDYAWTVDGTFFSDEQDPQRVFTTAGTYEICLTATDADGATDTHCEQVIVYTGPDITFVANVGSGCPPLDVQFTASSPDVLSELAWDFGDGNLLTTTDMSVTNTYISASVYDVTLTATNAQGCSNSFTLEDAVEVLSSINPEFSADNTSACEAPLTVNFSDNTADLPADASFSWNFGNGDTSEEQNPSVTYNNPGDYDVSLTITDNATGCANTTTLPAFIQIAPAPQFSFTTDVSGNCNQVTASFTDETPTDVVVYLWQFGDGATSNLPNPTHTYSAAGCHEVTLTTTLANGCVTTYTSPDCIEVSETVPLTYTTDGPTEGCSLPHSVSFSTDFNGPVSWDFGGLGSSSSPNPTYDFQAYGIFPVTLSATLPNGCVQTVTEVQVSILSPEPDFKADIREGCAPLTVQFVDISEFPEAVTEWLWDFGDGNTSTEQNPQHTYTEAGEYTVSLTVVLASGCEGVEVKPNYIEVGTPPNVAFEADPQETCIENIISFEDTSNDENIDEWLWDFGDGSFSTEQHPLHEYNDTGWFDVKLVVGYNGCYDSLAIVDYMHLLPPKAVFTSQQNCSEPGVVTFTDASIGADEWLWDFGDGNTSTEPSPTHSYEEAGAYIVNLEVYNAQTGCYDDMQGSVFVQNPHAEFTLSPQDLCIQPGINVSALVTDLSEDAVQYSWYAPGVFIIMDSPNDAEPEFRFFSPGQYTGMQLTVTDASGCSDVYVYTDTITVSQVTANFNATLTDTGCGQTFEFTDQSAALYSEVVSWAWDFGDGNTSTEQNPSHTYGQAGLYAPSLTVTSSAGCSHTFSIPSPVSVELPEVAFTADDLVCPADTIVFNNNSVASEFVSWEWTFGDGSVSSDWNPTHAFAEPGVYEVCLTATNADGCSGYECQEITVDGASVDFTADEVSATCSPHVVQFQDLSENVVAWEWDFGDNTGTSSLQNPGHTYISGGTFTVCLTATTAAGCIYTICKENFIQIGGPTATVSYQPGPTGCLDYTVGFDIQTENTVSYVLDFGDGAVASENNLAQDQFFLEHTYTAAGAFAPVLLLSDGEGCNSTVLLDTIRTQSLSIDFSASESEFCQGAGVSVNFNSIINTTGNVQSVEWVFEGLGTSNMLNPNGAVYPNPGTFDVTLTVNTEYCSDTIIKPDYITVHPAPVLDFVAEPATHCGPSTVAFTNNSDIPTGEISFWGWEFDNGQISNSQHPEPIYYGEVGDYLVTLSAQSDKGCMAEETSIVRVYEPAVAEIEQYEVSLCQGQTVQLQSVGNGIPSWSPSAGLSCDNCASPTANPNTTTLYHLTVTTPDGCTATDSVLVERLLVSPPVVELEADSVICQGDIVQIIATGGDTPFDYTWDDSVPGLSCYANCSNPLVDIQQTSTFTVTVTNDAGCQTVDSKTISVVGSNVDLLGVDRTICKGDSLQLQVLAGDTPDWQNAPGISCDDCPAPMVAPDETTTYQVTVDYQGCDLSDEVTVAVLSPDEVDAGDDNTICKGEMIRLNGDAPGDMAWSLNGTVFDTENLNPEVSPAETSQYVLSMEEDLCMLSDSVWIFVREKLELVVEDVEVCEGGEVQLQAFAEGADSYEWAPAEDLADRNIPDPMVSPTETTTYQVTASSDYCESDVATVTVYVTGGPEVALPTEQTFLPGASTALQPHTDDDGSYAYQWWPNRDISCNTCPSPTVSPDSTTLYTVQVTNADGCVTQDSVLLRPLSDCLGENMLIVPTGFSPNGDGNNDELRVLGMVEVSLFRVYNRWGELIFETDNPSEGWDGTYQSKPVNTDVYVWYVEASCPLDGSVVTRKGDVTLLR